MLRNAVPGAVRKVQWHFSVKGHESILLAKALTMSECRTSMSLHMWSRVLSVEIFSLSEEGTTIGSHTRMDSCFPNV